MPLCRVGAASPSAKANAAHGQVEEVYTTTLPAKLQPRHFTRLVLLKLHFRGSCCMLEIPRCSLASLLEITAFQACYEAIYHQPRLLLSLHGADEKENKSTDSVNSAMF